MTPLEDLKAHIRTWIEFHENLGRKHPDSPWWNENVAKYRRWLAALDALPREFPPLRVSPETLQKFQLQDVP